MMRSLYSAVSALRNHQTRLDVIGNNIANVNTTAFKSGRVTFKEAYAQVVRGAQASTATTGGVNPLQVGLGMDIAGIDQLFTQGNLQSTGVTTDLAVQGDSLFVVSDGVKNLYTRAGDFRLDGNGNLVASNGLVLQGRRAVNGQLMNQIGGLRIPIGQKSPAKATTEAVIGGNLDAGAAENTGRETTIMVYDAQGTGHELTVTYTKLAAPNQWQYQISVADLQVTLTDASGAPINDPNGQVIEFNEDGTLNTPESIQIAFTPNGATTAQSVTLKFGKAGDLAGLTQFAGTSSASILEQDGYAMGELDQIDIDDTGVISGTFTNGTILTLGQVALANFNNPSGLIRSGDNMYSASANSGAAQISYSGEGSDSQVVSRALEMSNVDISREFTEMITTQRGFQANARVITTTDSMLEEVVNLKR
jgi:flagellar hook protein FlgE